MEFREITAKTVDEAITKACLELETSSDNLEIQVVREGTSGFFGIGSKPAIIRVRRKVEEEEFNILEELKRKKPEKKLPERKQRRKKRKRFTGNPKRSRSGRTPNRRKKRKSRFRGKKPRSPRK